MSHIFSFIHCGSTQIMCQVYFEIQNCNAKLLKIHYNIIASFKKEKMLIPTLVLHTGDREGSL